MGQENDGVFLQDEWPGRMLSVARAGLLGRRREIAPGDPTGEGLCTVLAFHLEASVQPRTSRPLLHLQVISV